MPKDSVIPWLITLVFLVSRGNLLCGIVAGLLMSMLSPSLDGLSDRMGLSLLSINSMQATFASWIDVPWVAWTRFNNTVVAGSFAIGVIAGLPVYLLSQVFFRVWGIRMIQRVMDTRVIRFLFGASAEDSPATDSSEPNLVTET